MSEGPPRTPESLFLTKGSLVELHPDLDIDILEAIPRPIPSDGKYRIFHIERHNDEGPDAAWIGPADAADEYVNAFDPFRTLEPGYYAGVFPIAITHLQKAK